MLGPKMSNYIDGIKHGSISINHIVLVVLQMLMSAER